MAKLTSGKKRRKRYLFRCANKRLKRILIALWSIAIIIEALVTTETWVCIRLSSDYLNEVFSATCTVAVLGNAILSILFGVYDKKTLGIPFQDVLNHSKIGGEQRFTIEVLTTSIVFAIVWYVLGCYNLLFAVLIQNVFLLLFSCDDLWNFLSDKETQNKTITEIIRDVDPSRYAVYVDNWFKDLNDALVPNNETEVEEYCGLFGLIIESAPENEAQIRSCISRHLQAYFNTACEKLGFVEAFGLLRRIIKFAPKDDDLGTRIALKYLERLKIQELIDTVNCEIADLVEQIFEDKHFIDEDKAMYAYNYFCAVFDNVHMNMTHKIEQTQKLLNFYCNLHEASYGSIKAKVIMNIVKYRIIDNDDVEGRRRLFFLLVEALNKKGHLSSDKYYIATISQIYRAFYFIIYLEDGSLKESYRRDLCALFQSPTNEKDRNPLSFMTLIYERAETVIQWLVMSAAGFGEKPKLFWEYRSSAMNWKKIVWTREEVTAFAFYAYKLIGGNIDGHPFVSVLESDEYTCDEKLAICKTILAQYDSVGFNSLMQNRVQQLSELSGITAANLDVFWENEHVYYQEKTLELVSAINQDSFSASKLKNADIWRNVQAQYKDGSLFQFDTSCSLFPGIRHTFPSTYEVLYEGFWKSVPDRVGNKIGNYLNKYIQEIMPHLVLSFKMDGINTLLNTLDGEMYRYRNYKYTNDISFGPMLRNTTEFKKLSSLLAAIPYDEKSQLCGYYFLKKDRIPFNFLLQYELRSLSSNQRTQSVARYEKDGMYAIGGFYFDYIHAMKYAERNILLEEITIFIHVDSQSGDGFQIQFNRK